MSRKAGLAADGGTQLGPLSRQPGGTWLTSVGGIVGLLTRYNTLAFLPDFNAIPGQLDAWSRAVSAWFDQIISNDGAKFGDLRLQYYNAMNFLSPPAVDISLFRRLHVFRTCSADRSTNNS